MDLTDLLVISEVCHKPSYLTIDSANTPHETLVPLSHGIPRVDDRRIISGIFFVIKNGLRWRDALKEYGSHKTIYNRFIRWSRIGVVKRIFSELAAKSGEPDQLMIDANHLKAHRTAASLLKKGMFPDVSDAPKAG